MGGVGLAGGVAEERSSANSCILVRSGGKKRSSANGGVRISSCISLERKPNNRRVVNTGSETKKGPLPFRGVGPRVAALGGWTDSLPPPRKCQGDQNG